MTIAGPPPAAEGTAEVVLTDPTRGFLLFRNRRGATATDRPQGPTIRDLTIRHDPLPFTQGRIVDLSADRRTITLAVDDGFPNVDAAPFTAHEPLVISANVFTADGARVKRVTEDARSNFKRFARIDAIDTQTAELRLADGIEPGGLQVDRRLALIPRHQNATLFIHADVTEPTYERVRVHSTANFAFEFNACDRPVVRDCVVTPAPNSGALVATNADGVHCNNCPRGPLVEGNTFRRTSDDPIVADTELMAVREFLDDQTVAVAADFGTRVGAGDRLVAATPSLERIGMLPAVDAVDERGGGITDDAVNPESVTFTDSVRDILEVGDALVGPRMRNREAVVRDNTVEATRARYVRFGGVAGGVIERNRFLGTNANGIELDASGDIRPGFSDLKGWSTDVRIRDNDIRDTGLVGVPSGIPRAIVVGVDGGEGLAPDASTTGRPHRNVTLSNNRIRGVAGHGIELADVEGVTIDGDRIENPNRIPVSDIAAYGIGLRNVRDATVTGVTVRSDADLSGFGWRVESEGVSVSDNRFEIDSTAQQAIFEQLREQ
ncbi:right-handed parallel beta-helix repeat-containing protein [Halobaculum limi]|uniref:right-handed parallel beta-helix repeat-containing protein n=1 Tax=Halobaculum limi TaxID=3031916 RepID=UPI0024076FA1|nr:right-handed parallel beta-helix repeat-containing protein [Halobaculum sp. YSMS11]